MKLDISTCANVKAGGELASKTIVTVKTGLCKSS
jgi:hypothetical protein